MTRCSVLISAALLCGALAGRAHAQFSGVTDLVDIVKSDNDRFLRDVEKLRQDYKKFVRAQELIDAQSKRTLELRKQTTALIASLEGERVAYQKKRPGLKPEEWGTDPDAVRDRARYEQLGKQIAGLHAFEQAELSGCIEAVRQARQYTGVAGVGSEIGGASGTDQGWQRIKGRVDATIKRCNEAAGRVKAIAAETQQAILATPAEPLRIANKSDKMVFYVLAPGGGDGARIDPGKEASVPMPADRVVRLRAEAQTPMREKILVLGKRGGKTITVVTATQHELTYTAQSGPASGSTTTKVAAESCGWKTSALSKKIGPLTATPMGSGRYATLKDDAIAWTIPPITAASFSKGISEPLMGDVTCKLEWLYDRTGSGGLGSKREETVESQYGSVTIWVMPQ